MKGRRCSMYASKTNVAYTPRRVGTILEETTASGTRRLYQIRRTNGTMSRLKTPLSQYGPLIYSMNPKNPYFSTTLEEPIFQR
jgi:hypothetical protein